MCLAFLLLAQFGFVFYICDFHFRYYFFFHFRDAPYSMSKSVLCLSTTYLLPKFTKITVHSFHKHNQNGILTTIDNPFSFFSQTTVYMHDVQWIVLGCRRGIFFNFLVFWIFNGNWKRGFAQTLDSWPPISAMAITVSDVMHHFRSPKKKIALFPWFMKQTISNLIFSDVSHDRFDMFEMCNWFQTQPIALDGVRL